MLSLGGMSWSWSASFSTSFQTDCTLPLRIESYSPTRETAYPHLSSSELAEPPFSRPSLHRHHPLGYTTVATRLLFLLLHNKMND